MYLFVFIFVILSVLGLFTEVYTLRIASIVGKQRVVADTMMHWHGGAYLFARDYKDVIAASGTFIGTGWCDYAIGSPLCGVTPNFVAGTINNQIYLPADYNTADTELRFSSAVYSLGNAMYVLTYVPNASVKLGYTTDQIYQQMSNTEMPLLSYGRVMTGSCLGGSNGHWLATRQIIVNGSVQSQICHPVPATVPDGTIGIISNLGDV